MDEAGLGPILGPLVVAGVALEGPRGTDPWRALSAVVSRAAPADARIQVADSKRVKQGPHGLARIERTVLCFWRAWRGELPATVRELLLSTGNDPDRLRRCPWYGDLELPLPLCNDRHEIELRAHLLARELRARDISLVHFGVRPVDVEEFNELIARTDNKSTTHFSAYSAVIAELLGQLPDGSHLVADRCGGRFRYLKSLRKANPGARVSRLRESPDLSEYRLVRGDRSVKITFASRGEDRSFPTALASCVAKYVRELFVCALNRWFVEQLPGLAPTAGYYTDGKRFLRDVDELVRARALPVDRLVRVR